MFTLAVPFIVSKIRFRGCNDSYLRLQQTKAFMFRRLLSFCNTREATECHGHDTSRLLVFFPRIDCTVYYLGHSNLHVAKIKAGETRVTKSNNTNVMSEILMK